MRFTFLVSLLFLAALACGSTAQRGDDISDLIDSDSAQISYSDNGGASCDDLVVIAGALDLGQGIPAERRWLDHHYPGYKFNGQSLETCPLDRWVDRIKIVTPDGQEVEVMFDITSFFGKP